MAYTVSTQNVLVCADDLFTFLPAPFRRVLFRRALARRFFFFRQDRESRPAPANPVPSAWD